MDDAAARARLDQDRAETTARAAALERDVARMVEASQNDNADDEHDPEGATIAFERAQAAAMLDAARSRLAELDAAAERLAAGRYGICDVCGGAIAPERLEVRPAATTCITCAGRRR